MLGIGSILRSSMLKFGLGQVVVTSMVLGALKKQGALT